MPINPTQAGLTLSGIAELIQGLGKLNDPNKDKRNQLQQQLASNPDIRDQYITQYQNDPNSINALLGRAPLIGKGGYDAIKGTITQGKLSTKGQADIDAAKLKDKLANNNLALLTKFSDPNYQGTDQEKEDYASLTGRASPGLMKERKVNTDLSQFNLDQDKINAPIKTQTAQFQLDEAKTKANDEADKLDRQKQDRIVATTAIARLGKGENLYSAYKKGTLSGNELSSVLATPETKAQFDLAQSEYFRDEQLKFEKENADANREATAQNKTMLGVKELQEKAYLAGASIGKDEAIQYLTNPRQILDSTDSKDQPVKDALNKIRDFNSKDPARLNSAKTQFNREADIIYKTIHSHGDEATQADIDGLNRASALAFGGTGFAPYIFDLGTADKNHSFLGFKWKSGQPVPRLVDSDPALAKEGKLLFPGGSSSNVKKEMSQPEKADLYEKLKKQYPNESPADIAKRVNNGG